MDDSGTLPPRPPWTRESHIRIDREGKFWHEGQPVDHPGLARAFASWVAVDPATGRYILRNATDWCFITVEDAPLVVRSLRVEPDGAVLMLLSDGATETLDPATLRLDGEDVPYCDVRSGVAAGAEALPARFSRQAALSLLAHVVLRDGAPWLVTGSVSHPLPRVPSGAGTRRSPH